MNNPNVGKVGKHFSKDYQPEKTGRRKNVFKKTQKDYDMSLDDMRQMLTDLLSMSSSELKKIVKDKNAPAFKLVIAAAINESIKKGNWTQVNYMADRLFGKALEKHEIDTPQGLVIEFRNQTK
jgi:hypothetical protein